MKFLITRHQSQGQTLVEFALILPIFVLLLVGIVDFGRAVYANNTIQNAAREAVRTAIVDQNLTVIEQVAVQHAVALGINTSDVDVNFLDADYTTGDCTATPDVGCIVEVVVHYEYNAATPVLSGIVGSVDMAGSSRQPIEFQNSSAP